MAAFHVHHEMPMAGLRNGQSDRRFFGDAAEELVLQVSVKRSKFELFINRTLAMADSVISITVPARCSLEIVMAITEGRLRHCFSLLMAPGRHFTQGRVKEALGGCVRRSKGVSNCYDLMQV